MSCVVHLLWINLVTDTFPAIALGVEPAEPGVMTHKPRGRKSSFFSGGVMSSIIYQGLLQGALVLAVYGYAIAKSCTYWRCKQSMQMRLQWPLQLLD